MSGREDEVRPGLLRRWRRWLLILALALTPRFFFELHRVEGVSMWPAFNEDGKGDWLLVLKSWVDRDPRLLDPIVVVDPDDGDRTVLKRVCALPGFIPRIDDGDLKLLDGSLGLESFVPRDLDRIQRDLVPIAGLGDLSFRPRGRGGDIVDGLRRVFIRPDRGRAALSEGGRHLLIEADDEGGASFRLPEEDFRDDHRGAGGRLTAGENRVRDIALSISFAASATPEVGTRLTIRHVLEENGEGEDLEILVTTEGLDLRLRGRGAPEARHRLEPGPGLVLRWILVDDHRALLAGRDGREESFELLSDSRRDLVAGSTRSYLRFDLEGSSVILSRLDTARDLHYTSPAGGAGSGRDWPGDRLFLLGDNSPASRDSRFWRSELPLEPVGRPVLVLWPWSRARLID